MRYWNDAAKSMHEQLFQNIAAWDEGVLRYVRERLQYAFDIKSPEMVCAIMRFCDARYEDSARLRFATAIRAMDARLYDIAYACWDDGGESFLYVDDDPDFPTGVRSASVMRDLCGNIMGLQGKLRAQSDNVIDGELCDLLSRMM